MSRLSRLFYRDQQQGGGPSEGRPVSGDLAASDSNESSALSSEALAWLLLMISGHAREADLAALERWMSQSPLHVEALRRAVRLRRLVAAQGRFDGHPSFWQRPLTRRSALIAATALIGGYAAVRPPLGLWPSVSELTSDYRTDIGEQRHIDLAKGLSVVLNTRTSVSLRSKPGHPGLELIAGEVMIDAALAAAEVKAYAGNCWVSGSRATVDMRYEVGIVRVLCVTGTVAVDTSSGRHVLTAGQQIISSHGSTGVPVSVDPTLVTAWRRGQLLFHNATLASIVAEINRYRPGRILVMNQALAERQFNGEFTIRHIDKVVNELEKLTNATATTLPGGIVLLT